MATLPIFQAGRLQVTVRNTFVDVAGPRSPRAARSSSTPPSLHPGPAERGAAEAGLQADGGGGAVTEHSAALSCGELEEDPSIPDTDDEWEVASSHAPHPRRLADVGEGLRLAPCARPACSSPLGAGGVVLCCSPVVNVIVCPSVPAYRDEVIVASDPRGPPAGQGTSPRRRRCSRCRGRMGDSCPCALRQGGKQSAACGLALAAPTPALPRSHAHAIAVKNVLVDAEDAPRALAETRLKVRCAGGHEGIVVERVVQRSRLSGKAREWLAARGAVGPAAPAAAGRTKLSSRARAFEPVELGAVRAPAREATSADAELPREKAAEPTAPSTAPETPKFGSALLRGLEEVLRRCAFVSGVTISARGAGGWRVQIDVHGRYLYLKEHVLACAQEALFDGLDEMEALRARGPAAGRSIPETVFDLQVGCAGPS